MRKCFIGLLIVSTVLGASLLRAQQPNAPVIPAPLQVPSWLMGRNLHVEVVASKYFAEVMEGTDLEGWQIYSPSIVHLQDNDRRIDCYVGITGQTNFWSDQGNLVITSISCVPFQQ